MRISTFFYTIKQGIVNIWKNKLFSLASIATMTACIFLFGLFYSIVVNFSYIVEKAEEGVAITVFFNEDTTKEQKDTIGAQLKKEDGVLKVNYVSADEAWNKFKDDDRAAPLSELASLVKNINMDNVQKYINNAQKAINVIQELTNKPTTNTNIVTPKTPRAMDKFFGD